MHILQLKGLFNCVVKFYQLLIWKRFWVYHRKLITREEKYIVAAFNKQQVVFHVHNVTQIHRISWDQIEKPSDIYNAESSQVIGVIKREGEMLLLLDFEKIICRY